MVTTAPQTSTSDLRDRPPYRAPAREVAIALRTSLTDGLALAEATVRLQQFGRNVVERHEWHLLRALSRRLGNTLTLILIAATGVSAALGDTADAIIIGVVVLIDVAVGLLYESVTAYRIDLIRTQVPRIAEVLRGGRARLVPVEDVVPGDLVVLRRGERVPADVRLTTVVGLRVDEAVLTGEPGDVVKTTPAIDAPAAVADQRNMAFAGTLVTTGSGRGVAVATGPRSLLGSLARRVVEAGWQVTPLELRLRQVGHLVGVAILCIAALLFALGLARGEAPAAMFRSALTLAVAAIPEDLTFILTIALAVGATRLLRHRVVVRHLTAAETLGDATVVATDKTGTLTAGTLTLRRVEGVSQSWGRASFAAAAADLLFSRALSGALVGTEAGTEDAALRGSAIDRALREGATAAGIAAARLRRDYPLFATLAFDPTVRYHASLHDDPQAPEPVLFALGAPETLLPRATAAATGTASVPLTAHLRTVLLDRAASVAASGTRVLAVCTRHCAREVRTLTHADVEKLMFLAFLFFDDPLRPDAADAVRSLHEAGVRVVLLTGDHPGTAAAIGEETGILQRGRTGVLEGTAIDRLADAALADGLLGSGVAARVDPLQKERIVSALQRRGEIVAMVGDGVNDAVALRRADLGVAVASATDVAKDASDLVLLDGGLSALKAAVGEGRRIRETVRTVLAYLLSTNLTEILAVAAALALAVPLPFLPSQLLWVNVVTDGTADIALALEPAATRRGERRPPSRRGLFHVHDLLGMFITAIAILVPTLVAYLAVSDVTGDLARARTAAFVTLAAGQLFTAFSYRSLTRPLVTLAPWSNPWLLLAEAISFALLVAAVHWPPLAALLGTVPLSANDWAAFLGLALVGSLGAELRKWLVPALAKEA